MEIFKDIPGYEGSYQVSNLGRVKSLARFRFNKDPNKAKAKIKEKIISSNINKFGYYVIRLLKDGERKSFNLHQLVAMAFLDHKPCGHKLVVDHINDNRLDNKVENLRIITNRENSYKTQGSYSSKYKGVYFRKDTCKWSSSIRIDNKIIRLGCFKNEYDAHLAYQKKLAEISK